MKGMDFDLSKVIDDFDEELYLLEEEYLKKFKVYPMINNINKNTIVKIKDKLKECILNDVHFNEEDIK